MSELCLISYIKNSYETLIQVLAEDKINIYKDKRENTPQEYETLLIKLEKEIRSHIQTEQQLKLFAESIQNNFDEIEIENKILRFKLINNENININNKCCSNEEKIKTLKKEIEINKKILKSYENQNLKLAENERKLKLKLIEEQKIYNEKEAKYIKEIESLKQEKINYEKKMNNQGENLYNLNSSKSQKYCDKNFKKINNINRNNNIINYNKNIYINSNLKEDIKINRKKRTNNNNNHQNGPALSASSSMEKIEKYLMNKFAKTQFHFKSKINIAISDIKQLNRKIPSPYNNSMAEKRLNNGFYSLNNKLLMNDSVLSNMPEKQKKKNNRQKSVENKTKIRNKNKQESLLKNLLMSNNNSAFNINIKKSTVKNYKYNNNSTYKKVPYTCNLRGKIRNTGGNKNNYGTNNNINYCGKIINNNINIYAHSLRQDNHNVYIKGNNDKSMNSRKGISGNSSVREFYSNRYNNNELINFRRNSFGKKK